MKDMKKKSIGCALLLLVLMTGLCACGNNTKTDEKNAATAAPAEATSAPAVNEPAAVKDALKNTDGIVEFPGAIICELIGLTEESYSEIVYFESEDGVSARCVIVLTANDSAAADKAESALNKYLNQRMKETQNYLPDEYKLLSAAKVERKGNTVVLIVGSDAAEETRAVLQGR